MPSAEMERVLDPLDPVTGCFLDTILNIINCHFISIYFAVSCPHTLVDKVQNRVFMCFETVTPDVVSVFCIYMCYLYIHVLLVPFVVKNATFFVIFKKNTHLLSKSWLITLSICKTYFSLSVTPQKQKLQWRNWCSPVKLRSVKIWIVLNHRQNGKIIVTFFATVGSSIHLSIISGLINTYMSRNSDVFNSHFDTN